jgi:hypothetical protein
MIRPLLVGTLLLLCNAAAQAQVHKCPGPDGKITFSQAPCTTPGGSQMTQSQLRGNAPRPARSPASAASAAASSATRPASAASRPASR